MTDRSVSVPMTLSVLERRDAKNQIFQADLPNNARTAWLRTTKLGGITLVGRGEFLGIQPRPATRGRGPALPNFGVPFYLCVHPLTQNYQIWRGFTWGWACILGSGTTPVTISIGLLLLLLLLQCMTTTCSSSKVLAQMTLTSLYRSNVCRNVITAGRTSWLITVTRGRCNNWHLTVFNEFKRQPTWSLGESFK